jgi:hypothetical protein
MTTNNNTPKKRFHVAWFIDQKKTMLAGTTVDAKDITDAVKVVCNKKGIHVMNDLALDISMIKYVMEL